MADIVFVAIALAFFGLACLYVQACDRIIGREALPSTAPVTDGGAHPVGASVVVVVSCENALALVLAVLLAGYLVAALLFPERF